MAEYDNDGANEKKRPMDPTIDPETDTPEAKRPKSGEATFVPNFFGGTITVNGTRLGYRGATFYTQSDTYTLCRFHYKYKKRLTQNPHYGAPGVYDQYGVLDVSPVDVDLIVDSKAKNCLEVVTVKTKWCERRFVQELLTACGITFVCISHTSLEQLCRELSRFSKNPTMPCLEDSRWEVVGFCFELDVGPDGVGLGYNARLKFYDRHHPFGPDPGDDIYHVESGVFVTVEQMAEAITNAKAKSATTRVL